MQFIKDYSDPKLLVEVASTVTKERLAIANSVAFLAELDLRGLYRTSGYSSLFAYCTEFLKYSNASTHRRVQAARILHTHPEVYAKLVSGELNLCTVAEIARVKDQEKKEELLVKAEGRSKREVEVMVAPLLQATRPTKTTIKPKAHAPSPLFSKPEEPAVVNYNINMEVDAEFMQLYNRAKELTSTSISLAELLKRTLKEYVAKREPKVAVKPLSVSCSRYIPKAVSDAVRIRDNNQCIYISPSGQRCTCRTGLEFDHIIPFAAGGSTEVDNLRLTCKARNQLHAENWFGKEFMQAKRAAL